MSTVTDGSRTRTPSSVSYMPEAPPEKGTGWITFASIMFMVVGTLNVIWGIAAVSSSTFFVNGAHYMISDLNTWGWIVMGWGALEFVAALSIWRGGAFGRWFGIVVAGIAIPLAMVTIPAYPFWGLTVVAIAILIVYGLAAYGGKPAMLS